MLHGAFAIRIYTPSTMLVRFLVRLKMDSDMPGVAYFELSWSILSSIGLFGPF